jgi:hypothetical protein
MSATRIVRVSFDVTAANGKSPRDAARIALDIIREYGAGEFLAQCDIIDVSADGKERYITGFDSDVLEG